MNAKAVTRRQKDRVGPLNLAGRGRGLESLSKRDTRMSTEPTARAIELAIALWHIGGCLQALRGQR